MTIGAVKLCGNGYIYRLDEGIKVWRHIGRNGQ